MYQRKTQLMLLMAIGLLISTTASSLSEQQQDCTSVAEDEETMLVFWTLGGGLTAIEPLTGETRWSIDDEPTIRVPTPASMSEHYLPDPRDGSLYRMNSLEGGLKKLPYTIPQLVASAPCRSSDGILYSGKKSDVWFLIDPKTGKREKVLGFGEPLPSQQPPATRDGVGTGAGSDAIGWATSRAVYLGRTQYTVMMYDSQATDGNSKPWNVTFFDYTAHTMAPELSKEYEFLHLTSSASGLTATFEQKKGTPLWQKDLSSPVVAVFLLSSEGLLSVPFQTVSDEVLQEVNERVKSGNYDDLKLFETVYVGEAGNNLYAIPSLVEKSTVTLTSEPSFNLLGVPSKPGPLGALDHLGELILKILAFDDKLQEIENKWIIVSCGMIETKFDGASGVSDTIWAMDQFMCWILLNLNWAILVLAGVECSVLVFLYFVLRYRNLLHCIKLYKQHIRQGKAPRVLRETSYRVVNGETIIDRKETVFLGKIRFDPLTPLAQGGSPGFSGNSVYRGKFEYWDAAVKRIHADCFKFSEVKLLVKSDAHENVVRYFCTEYYANYGYIAMELCAATLQDYVELPLNVEAPSAPLEARTVQVSELRKKISALDILHQTTMGLMHLHALGIVHRDIKPQNILLSLPDNLGCVRAKISDFGLCTKVNCEEESFSRDSGVTGTGGWIAPEMQRDQRDKRATTSVDIFSFGCVIYYVLSNGFHPFGDSLKRQLNIVSGEFDLGKLRCDNNRDILAHEIIKDMIQSDGSKRPPARAIANHPLFWSNDRILRFWLNVSERMDKLKITDELLRTVEKNALFVVQENWFGRLDNALKDNLRNSRGYCGSSVSHLLRACRNKRNHYLELPSELRIVLGEVPNKFTDYWISRFPHLLSHTYHALADNSREPMFLQYYNDEEDNHTGGEPVAVGPHGGYKFTPPDYFQAAKDNDELKLYYELEQDMKKGNKSTKR